MLRIPFAVAATALLVTLANTLACTEDNSEAELVKSKTHSETVEMCLSERDRWESASANIISKRSASQERLDDYMVSIRSPNATQDLIDSAKPLIRLETKEIQKFDAYLAVCAQHTSFYKKMLEKLELGVSPSEVAAEVEAFAEEYPAPSWLQRYTVQD